MTISDASTYDDEEKTPRDLTKDAIKKALTDATATTGITIDVHDIEFGTDHGAEWDGRSPMTIVRGEISLRKLSHIASKFYITFDADTPTPAATSTITVHDIGIELLPHVDDTVCGAFEACDIRITGPRDDAFALVAHMLTGQIWYSGRKALDTSFPPTLHRRGRLSRERNYQ